MSQGPSDIGKSALVKPAGMPLMDVDPPRVFVLEDNQMNLFVLRQFLEELDVEHVTTAHTLEQAEQWWEPLVDGTFRVAILDIMLPDGESWALAKRLRDIDGLTLCAYTARISDADNLRHMDAGFDHVFGKPLTFSDFSTFMEGALSNGEH